MDTELSLPEYQKEFVVKDENAQSKWFFKYLVQTVDAEERVSSQKLPLSLRGQAKNRCTYGHQATCKRVVTFITYLFTVLFIQIWGGASI